MRSIICILPLFCSALAIGNDYESSYTIENTSFTIKLKIQEITTYYGQEKLVNYSVYKNGKFIHPKNYEGGRFISHSKKQCKLYLVGKHGKEFGWLIEGHGIDGNTHSYKYDLVIPNLSTTSKSKYLNKQFVAKRFPLIQINEKVVSLWYYEQNWGKGGTSTSIYVPRRLDVITNNLFDIEIRKGNILDGIEILNNPSIDDYLMPNFLGLFVAGIQDLNSNLMKYALEKYFNKNELSWYKGYGLPTTKKDLEELVKKVDTAHILYDQVDSFVDWGI